MNEETALQRAPVDFFLDRLQDMPDIEAIQEIDIRLDAMAVKRKSLAGKQDANIAQGSVVFVEPEDGE